MRRSLGALLCAYFVAGVFGRFPWKADEPYSFGIAWAMLKDGAWLVPRVADQPFVEKPPLVYWLGALTAKALPAIAPHESSRIAVLLLLALAAAGLFAAARLLHAEVREWADELGGAATLAKQRHFETPISRRMYGLLALLLMAGTVGFAEHVHKLTADLGQLTGAIIALVGLVDVGRADPSRRSGESSRWSGVRGGVLLGAGAGCAFMSKGLFVPGILAVTAAACLVLRPYRTRRAALAFALAVAVAMPWFVVWPLLLHHASPQLFDEWLWTQNLGRFLGRVALGGNNVSLLERTMSLLAMGFPAALLCVETTRCAVASTLARGAERRWRITRDAPGHVCVAIYLAASIVTLGVSASFRSVYALPALPAMILLALPALEFAPAAPGVRRAAIVGFGAALVLVAGASIALALDGDLAVPAWLHDRIGDLLPLPFHLDIRWPSIFLAAVAVVAWWRVVRLDTRRSATVAWCAGFAMLWTVTFTLLLPWIDAARSYRAVFTDVGRIVASSSSCITTVDLGESELAMFEYVTRRAALRLFRGHSGVGDRARPDPVAFDCEWYLEESNRSLRPAPPPTRWKEVWSGSRPADADERFTLYREMP